MQQLAQNDDRCYGVKIGNEGLLKILNRGINLVGADGIAVNDFLFRKLADGNDAVGIVAGTTELVVIDFAVNGLVSFGKAQEKQVVYGDDGPYTLCLADIQGQFVGQSVEDLDAVLFQPPRDAVGAPECPSH